MKPKDSEPLALRQNRTARQLLAPLDYLVRVASETGFFRLALLLIEARAEAQSLGFAKGRVRSAIALGSEDPDNGEKMESRTQQGVDQQSSGRS
jgi:hypothetical protein